MDRHAHGLGVEPVGESFQPRLGVFPKRYPRLDGPKIPIVGLERRIEVLPKLGQQPAIYTA
jgi:hypothetical protein